MSKETRAYARCNSVWRRLHSTSVTDPRCAMPHPIEIADTSETVATGIWLVTDETTGGESCRDEGMKFTLHRNKPSHCSTRLSMHRCDKYKGLSRCPIKSDLPCPSLKLKRRYVSEMFRQGCGVPKQRNLGRLLFCAILGLCSSPPLWKNKRNW